MTVGAQKYNVSKIVYYRTNRYNYQMCKKLMTPICLLGPYVGKNTCAKMYTITVLDEPSYPRYIPLSVLPQVSQYSYCFPHTPSIGTALSQYGQGRQRRDTAWGGGGGGSGEGGGRRGGGIVRTDHSKCVSVRGECTVSMVLIKECR